MSDRNDENYNSVDNENINNGEQQKADNGNANNAENMGRQNNGQGNWTMGTNGYYTQNQYGQNSNQQNPYGQNQPPNYKANPYQQQGTPNYYNGYAQGTPQYKEQPQYKEAPVQDNYQWNFQDYENAAKENKPKAKKSKGLIVFTSLIAMILVVGVVSFSGFAIYTYIADSNKIPDAVPPANSQPNLPGLSLKDKPDVADEVLPEGRLTTSQIAKKVKPSVVGIVKYEGNNSFAPSSEGSGIIMTSDGYIVTNAHVVENAIGIKVVLDNGEEYSAELRGLDTKTDLAVIKIQAENLSFADFGNSDQIEVGEKAVAIGNPNGMQLSGSVTQGIISAVDRPVKSENGYTMDFIQTDAAINPGNSGGALVNEFGQVIGINSAKFIETGFESIGFAIPVNKAVPVIEELIKNGKVTGRAMLGVSGEAIDGVVSQYYNIPRGVHILSIDTRSDLVAKKVVPGDIITKINDIDVASADDISQILIDLKPGDSVKLSIYRRTNSNVGAKTFDVSVLLISEAEEVTYKTTAD